MSTTRSKRGFTLAEAILAIALVGITMGLLALLFHRSFEILKVIDDKERSRQASRMGLDRITNELREAVSDPIINDALEFEKINPNAQVTIPPLSPKDVDPEAEIPDTYVPPDWGPNDAYPDSSRLRVRYFAENDKLIRQVRKKDSGSWVTQVVVVGVNAFTCQRDDAGNPAEIEVTVSVLDGGRVVTLSSRVIMPCIRKSFL